MLLRPSLAQIAESKRFPASYASLGGVDIEGASRHRIPAAPTTSTVSIQSNRTITPLDSKTSALLLSARPSIVSLHGSITNLALVSRRPSLSIQVSPHPQPPQHLPLPSRRKRHRKTAEYRGYHHRPSRSNTMTSQVLNVTAGARTKRLSSSASRPP